MFQPLDTFAIHFLAIGGQPAADHQHAGGVDDGIEGLAIFQARLVQESTVEAFGNVLNGDFVAQRNVIADIDVFCVNIPGLQLFRERGKIMAVCGITVDQDDRSCHWMFAPGIDITINSSGFQNIFT